MSTDRASLKVHHDREPLQPAHAELVTSRRDFLERAGGGFGALALTHLLAQDALLATEATSNGGSASASNKSVSGPHFRPRAKSVIFLFLDGGPSHIDTFDPKPAVNRYAGQTLPPHIERPYLPMGETDSAILASPRTWKRYGQSGIPVSNWMPHVGECIDDIAVIRSCVADGLLHVRGVTQMNTGFVEGGRPSLGSWCSYGLGAGSDDLPAFVVMLDRNSEPPGGTRNWGTGFMPAAYQGTRFREGAAPILHLERHKTVSREQQRRKLDLIGVLNRRHARRRQANSQLEARIASYELAYRMQASAPEAVDLSRESEATRRLYGLESESTATYGRMCLLARRLVERGVRFIQLYSGSGSKWDAHVRIEKNHTGLCRSSDLPIAGLLKDLKQRGMLDETLVVWGGEFGRTPQSEKGDGRDHNPYGFTMWMAGGGVKGGQIIGATDEFGLHAIEDRAHVHDLHATILHALGLDHQRLTYRHNGRDERLTDVSGNVIKKLFV